MLVHYISILNLFPLLIIYGFGNLRGNLEIWDMKKHKLVSQTTAPDSTYLEWCPDSIHFCTATTAPRLQIGNGYKIWHYSGSLLHEYSCNQDEKLYEVKWQNKPYGTYQVQEISYKSVAGIASNQPQASKQAYVPPSARNDPHMIRKITEQYELPSNAKPTSESASKNAARNRKKKENKKAKKAPEVIDNGAKPLAEKSSSKPAAPESIELTGNVEVDKKIRNLSKKLDAILKLKEQQNAGKDLEINQLEKIKKEQEILSELDELRISN
ncbi:Eukaryotic translation initiation factor 2A [Nymphon striatum]|nr:Eukaryotic translation initiation factor 2A [Nymphon striatum]